jgi:hypothetical protein
MPVPSVVSSVSRDIARRAVARLGDTGDVGVVGEVDLAAEAVLEELLGFEAHPGLGDVRRRQRLAVLDDRGKATPSGMSASVTPSVSSTVFTAASTSSGSAPAASHLDAVAEQVSPRGRRGHP